MGPPSAGPFKAVALADFNGDGIIDLAGGDTKKNRIYIWYGSPGVKWSRPISFKVEGEVRDIATIDLNSDGISDFVYSLRGTPGGIYTRISAPHLKDKWVVGIPAATEGLYEGLSVADIDGDGHWDLAAANATTEQDGGVQVFRGDGMGGWIGEIGPTRAGIYRDVRLVDLNGDGRIDLVAAGWGAESGIHVWLQREGGGWNGLPLVAQGNFWGVWASDLNGDGRIDLAASTFQEGIRIYWAKTDGLFEEGVSPVDNGSFWRVRAADMNKDGHPDLLASSIDGQGVRLWLNDGTGGWDEDNRYLPKFGVFYGLSIQDIDGDGKLDVTVASRQNGVKVWLQARQEGAYAKAKLPEHLAKAVAVVRQKQAIENQSSGQNLQPNGLLSPPGRSLLYPLKTDNKAGVEKVKTRAVDGNSPKAVLTGTHTVSVGNNSDRPPISSQSVAQGETPATETTKGFSRPPSRSSTEVVPPSNVRGPVKTENHEVEKARTVSMEKSQSRSLDDAWKPPGTPKPYRIGIGDRLEITMWRGLEADLHKVIVDEKGKIVFAFLENVQAAGLTVNQLDNALSKRLQRFIKRPRLDIRVTEFLSQSFTMLGEISKPGRYPITGPIRILDAIIAGGGPSQSADTRNVKVLRRGKSVPVDLEAIFEGDQRTNILLEDQDQVLLSKLDVRRGAILVVGQLPRQGSFPIRPDLRVLDAVLAAGCCRRVSPGDPLPDIRRARVIRKGKVIPVNLESILLQGDQKQNILLQNGDQVIVPGEARGSLTVVGEISKPGRYSIEGRTQILDVILLAGGQRATADLTKVRIYREGKPIAINLAQVLFQGDARQNIVIRDGDQVVVPPLPPERRRKLVSDRRIYVLGEVKLPGVYAFPPRVQNLSLLDALTRAGGFTKFAVGSSSKIIRGDIERPLILSADIDRLLEKGDITQNVPLKDQDIIFVPRSFIGDANDWMDKIRPFLTFFLFPATYRDAYATSTEALRVDIGGQPRTGGGALQTIELSQ